MKKLFLIIAIIILCLSIKAQTSYYFYDHEGKKVYLSLNTEYVFLSVKEPQLPDGFAQCSVEAAGFLSDKSDKRQYQSKKKNKPRFYTELKFEEKLSDEQYLKLLSDIKRQNRDAIISPYFKMKDDDVIGLSNFFYVKLKAETDTTLLRKIAEQKKCIVIEQDPFMPLWFVLSTTEASEHNALYYSNAFHESGLFQSAGPDLMVNVKACVNDPFFNQQWGLKNTGQSGGTSGIDIKACDAWQISRGENVIVAIIDQGIDLNHPDLAANIHPLKFDCDTRSATQQFVRGNHGTPVAGIVGALQNNFVNGNREGISGVAPNSTLMSISSSFNINLNNPILVAQDLAWGINQARQNNRADVINCSWGHDALSTGGILQNAIDLATTQGRNNLGCVVVAASHNQGGAVVFPASLGNVISVGAINRNGTRSSDSNYGNALDVVAPGTDIYTTDRQGNAGYNTANGTAGDYTNFSQTSAATPHVAGIAALILSVRPDLTQEQVRQAIESACTKLSGYGFSNNSAHPNGTRNNQVGHGLVNACHSQTTTIAYFLKS